MSPPAAVSCLTLELCGLPVDSPGTEPSVGRIIYEKEKPDFDILASCCEFLVFMARNTDFSFVNLI